MHGYCRQLISRFRRRQVLRQKRTEVCLARRRGWKLQPNTYENNRNRCDIKKKRRFAGGPVTQACWMPCARATIPARRRSRWPRAALPPPPARLLKVVSKPVCLHLTRDGQAFTARPATRTLALLLCVNLKLFSNLRPLKISQSGNKHSVRCALPTASPTSNIDAEQRRHVFQSAKAAKCWTMKKKRLSRGVSRFWVNVSPHRV